MTLTHTHTPIQSCFHPFWGIYIDLHSFLGSLHNSNNSHYLPISDPDPRLNPKIKRCTSWGPGPHKSVGPHMVSQLLVFIEKKNHTKTNLQNPGMLSSPFYLYYLYPPISQYHRRSMKKQLKTSATLSQPSTTKSKRERERERERQRVTERQRRKRRRSREHRKKIN